MWFDVDKEGLARILERRGKEFVLLELIQNALDTDAQEISVELKPESRGYVRVIVRDNSSTGFSNLAHSWTLFAESERKSDSEKRGRFNLGEKLVLACCKTATIRTMSGSVTFNENGRRNQPSLHTEIGSEFEGVVRMTLVEMAAAVDVARTVIVPQGRTLTLNGVLVPSRSALSCAKVELPTEIADEEGCIRGQTKKCPVYCYEPFPGETPHLYEMGIPVVELQAGVRWHVNVSQKIPLPMDRDNVSPAYLKKLYLFLAATMAPQLDANDATSPWLDTATSDPKAPPAAVEAMMDLRFGKERASHDMSDREANCQLTNAGYAIVHGGSLSAGQWENARSMGLIQPAGVVRPSRPTEVKPDTKFIYVPDYTEGMRNVVSWTARLAPRLLGHRIVIQIIDEPRDMKFDALYGRESKTLTFNAGRLGFKWFDKQASDARSISKRHVKLVLHEFSHDRVSEHTDPDFAEVGFDLAAALWDLALTEPKAVV